VADRGIARGGNERETTMRKRLLLAMTLVMMAAFAAPGASSAKGDRDEHPCADKRWDIGRGLGAQYCPMWRGHVAIHAERDPDSRIVGYLENAKGNWFECQAEGESYRAPDSAWSDVDGYWNAWWAYTLADGTGEWGWAPEAFFLNGGRHISNGNFPDGNLAYCFGPE
jgi:hypothetical protein